MGTALSCPVTLMRYARPCLSAHCGATQNKSTPALHTGSLPTSTPPPPTNPFFPTSILSYVQLYEQAKQGHARPFHVSARRLMPLAFELPTQEDVSCKTKEAIWHHGVRSTNYHRWLRESARGIHGAFKVQVRRCLEAHGKS